MSNYPPGVSPNDPHIVGYDERDEFREVEECTEIDRFVVHTNLNRYVTTFGGRIRRERRATGVLCTFVGGEVPGIRVFSRTGESTFYWECPVCGTLNELEIEPDEPEERSYWDD